MPWNVAAAAQAGLLAMPGASSARSAVIRKAG